MSEPKVAPEGKPPITNRFLVNGIIAGLLCFGVIGLLYYWT